MATFAQAPPTSSPGFGTATATATTSSSPFHNAAFTFGKSPNDNNKPHSNDVEEESPTGIAILFLEHLDALLEPHSGHDILPLNQNNAVHWTERLLECQAKFKSQGKPTRIDIGYHYTHAAFFEGIQNKGLMTIDDRVTSGHQNTRNTAFFGDGIYLANNPFSHQKFGSLGLMVAVLTGSMHHMGTKPVSSSAQPLPDCDTIIGNKKSEDRPFFNEIIPRNSCQVLPLVQFQRDNALCHKDALWSVHEQLQGLLDAYFNEGKATVLTRFGANSLVISQGPGVVLSPSELARRRHTTIKNTATNHPKQSGSAFGSSTTTPAKQKQPKPFSFGGSPQTSNKQNQPFTFSFGQSPQNQSGGSRPFGVIYFAAPESLSSTNDMSDSSKEPRGRSPSGTMQVSTMAQDCAGFSGIGTICICYLIPGDKQKPYHVCPGEPFQGLRQQTYIPNSREGQQLLERLEYAFSRGLTFDVLPAHLTTVANPQHAYLAWLPFQNHRTSLEGTSHTWLKSEYLKICNSELDVLGVPRSPGHHPAVHLAF